MFKRFKEFAFKGNVLDMAVGVVIGNAFKDIVNALVANVIMPLVSVMTGGVDFTAWAITLVEDAEAPILLEYGMLIQRVVDFFLIAISMFIVMSLIGWLKDRFAKKQAAVEEAAAPAGPTDTELLTEIRDLLKEQNK